MTLHKKITLGMLTGLALMFLTVSVINFFIQRQYYRLHLDHATQNIEVALSVFLETPLREENYELVIDSINEVFDDGLFQMIQVLGPDNEVLINREKLRSTQLAPQWFVRLIRWPSLIQSMTIKGKRKLLGRVVVAPEASHAYDALWHGFTLLLAWFFFWMMMSLLVSHYFARWLLRPYRQVVRQAKALSARQFIFEKQASTVFEFKTVSLVMNQLVQSLQTIFQKQLATMEALRCDLFQDCLTGLGNHRYFLYHLSALLYRDKQFIPGFILGISLENLSQIKENLGEAKTKQLIQEVGSLCLEFWRVYPELVIARSDENQFGLLIRENDERALLKKCEEFNAKLQKLVTHKTYCEILFGVVSYSAYQDRVKLLDELHQTLAAAKNEPAHLALSKNLATHRQREITKAQLMRGLSQESECLEAEVVSDGEHILHYEISSLFFMNEERVHSDYVMPLLRENGLTRQLDAFILDQICEQELLGLHPVAFTLSEASLTNMAVLTQDLLKIKAIPKAQRKRLSFEVEEFCVLNYWTSVSFLFKELHALGIQLGVKQVGIQNSVMTYLNDLPLSYIKLHGSLSHDPDEDSPFVIHYLQEMASLLNLKIIATQVQSAEEWQRLQKKGLVWGQGVYFDAAKAPESI